MIEAYLPGVEVDYLYTYPTLQDVGSIERVFYSYDLEGRIMYVPLGDTTVPPGVYAVDHGKVVSMVNGEIIARYRGGEAIQFHAYRIPIKWRFADRPTGDIPTDFRGEFTFKLFYPVGSAKVGDAITVRFPDGVVNIPGFGSLNLADKSHVSILMALTIPEKVEYADGAAYPVEWTPLNDFIKLGISGYNVGGFWYEIPEAYPKVEAPSDAGKPAEPVKLKHPALSPALEAQIKAHPTSVTTRVLVNQIVASPIPPELTTGESLIEWIHDFYSSTYGSTLKPLFSETVTASSPTAPASVPPLASTAPAPEPSGNTMMYNGARERYVTIDVTVEEDVDGRQYYTRRDTYSGEMNIPFSVVRAGSRAVDEYIRENYTDDLERECGDESWGDTEDDDTDVSDVSFDFDELSSRMDDIEEEEGSI